MPRSEQLIRTPNIAEAAAHLEAFVAGRAPTRLWIVGPAGCGKSFLAQWARALALNGRRGAILDDAAGPGDMAEFAVFSRAAPQATSDVTVVFMGEPEFERKRGVLLEWAAARDLEWEEAGLNALLAVAAGNLQTLRSLAERAARESAAASGQVRELDVIRTLSRLGLIGP